MSFVIPLLSTVAYGTIALLLYQIVRLALASGRGKGLPPGPPTLPLIGNLHQIPTKKSYLKFQQWGKEYGPVVSLKIGSGNMVVLNSAAAVRDLFDKRGAIYSSRPPNYVGTEVIARDNVHLLLMPYGPEWRAQRKIYQQLLNINVVASLQKVQNAESCLTMFQLARSPEKYYDHIRRYSTAVILSSVFGLRGPEFDHHNVQRLYHVQDQFTAILETGATPPIDVFPILKHLPNLVAPWRKWALSIRREQRQLYFELLNSVKSRLKEGIQRTCFMDHLLLKESQSHNMDDEHIAYIGGVLMEGGSDTTASTLLSFLLAMVKYPAVLAAAQKEVDLVCGLTRSPTFQDLPQLPFIKSCATEAMRWRPVAPGGIPHVLTQDDNYESYFFPKGTIFIANTWAIHMDGNLYDRPEEFDPHRYMNNKLSDNSELGERENLRQTYAFGAGRRICPGQHLAENSLHINIAKLVWTFSFGPGKSNTGRQMTVDEIDSSIDTAWTDGFLTAPKPFPMTIKPRSREHINVIERELQAARDIFKEYED